jgi:hypothetical protein
VNLLTSIAHVVLALAVLGAAAALAAVGTIPGSDAFTVIVGVAVGGGVLAGANLTSGGSSGATGAPPANP